MLPSGSGRPVAVSYTTLPSCWAAASSRSTSDALDGDDGVGTLCADDGGVGPAVPLAVVVVAVALGVAGGVRGPTAADRARSVLAGRREAVMGVAGGGYVGGWNGVCWCVLAGGAGSSATAAAERWWAAAADARCCCSSRSVVAPSPPSDDPDGSYPSLPPSTPVPVPPLPLLVVSASGAVERWAGGPSAVCGARCEAPDGRPALSMAARGVYGWVGGWRWSRGQEGGGPCGRERWEGGTAA